MNQKEIDRAVKAMYKAFNSITIQTMRKKEDQEVRKALQSSLDKTKKAYHRLFDENKEVMDWLKDK